MNTAKKSISIRISKILVCSLALIGILHAPLQAHDNTGLGYVHDKDGRLILNSRGECIKTSHWTAEIAIPKCEGIEEAKVIDADQDGIADASDKCPGTPAGVSVNSSGCAIDSDNDGVSDSADKCPATPAGAMVDAAGCEKDSDKDGIADSSDKCPSTPAGYPVDASGCPRDTDSDGIVDAIDQCPKTASGAIVDATGCKLKESISLENVLFKTGTAVIDNDSRKILERIAKVIAANEHLSFEIAGHTDNAGSYANNVKLSEMRAQSVRQFLMDSGIAPERLKARGYGPDRPIASNDTPEGRRQNRRVELNRLQ